MHDYQNGGRKHRTTQWSKLDSPLIDSKKYQTNPHKVTPLAISSGMSYLIGPSPIQLSLSPFRVTHLPNLQAYQGL